MDLKCMYRANENKNVICILTPTCPITLHKEKLSHLKDLRLPLDLPSSDSNIMECRSDYSVCTTCTTDCTRKMLTYDILDKLILFFGKVVSYLSVFRSKGNNHVHLLLKLDNNFLIL